MDADSAGAITVKTVAGRSCPGRLSSDDARRLGEAVANAKPEAWTPQVPVCCDRIEWSLELTIGGKTHNATWIDDPDIALPDDLRALTRLLAEIREKHTRSCRP